jgi:phosphoglycerate dehydrogenase-like enzyme
MLRVGYPAAIDAEFLRDFPAEVELIPLPGDLDHEVEIDIWLPGVFPAEAHRLWPHLRGVRLVLALVAGTEWIPPITGPGVTICNTRGAGNIAPAEWVTSAILATLKYFPLYLDAQCSGQQWRRRAEANDHYARITGDTRSLYPPVTVEELTGKRVLLVGHGAIGQEIERMLAPFHVELTRVARRARTEPPVHAVSELDMLLPQAEIVILILPLTPESHHLIGRRQLALMRQGALLVNAARGAIVDTDALMDALNSGRIRAALDVTDPEPLPEDHPLWNCPNVILTPHAAGTCPQFTPRALAVAASELRRYLAGEPLINVVQTAIR